MKKILITGGSGFIGRNLKEGLSNKYEVFAPNHDELDLLNEKEVIQYLYKYKFDVILHSAYQKIKSIHKKMETSKMLEWNLKIFMLLLNNNDKYGKMYYFGSGAEYDMQNYIPLMKEEYFGKYVPNDSYGFSKYIMSKLCESSDNVIDLRLFGVYGKYEQWTKRFISNAICRCMMKQPITIEKNVYFDYLYIDDLVRIVEWFIENNPKHKHYNVTRGKSIDLFSIAEKVKNITNQNCEIKVKEKGLKSEYSANNERLIEEIGKIEFTKIDDGIKKLFEYYKNDRTFNQVCNIEFLDY